MIKPLMLLLLLIIGNGALFAKTIMEDDFSNPKRIFEYSGYGDYKVKNGILTLKSSFKKQVRLEKIVPAIKGNVKVSFKVRRIAVPACDSFWGISLNKSNGNSLFLYSRGKGLTALLKKGKDKIFHRGLSPANYKFTKGPNSSWTTVTLFLSPKGLETNLDEGFAGRLTCDLLPLNKITFSSWYGVNVEIDDFKVSTFTADKNPTRGSETPVFHAKFDKNLTAKGLSSNFAPSISKNITFVPGISGQAVRLGKDYTKLIRLGNKWQIYNGVLKVNNNHKSVQNVVFKLPKYLKTLKLKYRIKRISAPPKGDQFGFYIYGTGTEIFRLYSNPKVGFFHILSKNGKKISHKLLKPRMKQPAPGNASPWQTIEVEANSKGVQVTVDGKALKFKSCNVFPLNKIVLYAYALDMEVDDLSISGIENVSGNAFSYVEDFSKPQGGTPILEYPAKNLFKNQGTLMFWLRPDWDGLIKSKLISYRLFDGVNANGVSKLNMFMWSWLRTDLGRTGKLRDVSLPQTRKLFFKGDWSHITLRWSNGSWNKVFVNGIGASPKIFGNLDLKSIARFSLGKPDRGMHGADGAIDELKIYNRKLSDSEIMAEFRKYMPIDLILDRAVLFSDKDEQIVLSAAPDGYYMSPLLTVAKLKQTAIKMNVRLVAVGNNKVLKEQNYDLTVTAPREITMPVGKLPMGEYRVKCIIKHDKKSIQKSFFLKVYTPKPLSPPTKQDIKLGDAFFSRDCGQLDVKSNLHQGELSIVKSPLGKYLETNDRNGSRFAFEITFAKKYITGKPVMIEIQWPDDKPRSMAFYMYPEAKRKQHRDRLEGGVQSGIEYPLTGKMQRSRYLFYPGVKRYLFECRNMANGFSAAVKSVKVYPITSSLPRLAINYPQGMKHRRFGYMDEDQTVDVTFNYDAQSKEKSLFRTAKFMENFCDYLDYTGQDTMAYALMRYEAIFYPMIGYKKFHLIPYFFGEVPLLIEMLNRRNKKFIAICNFSTLPEIFAQPDRAEEFEKLGYSMKNIYGRLISRKVNFANPTIKKMIVRHFREVASRYGNMPGFDGFDFWIYRFGSYGSLNEGYSDYTVKCFLQKTKTSMPEYTGIKRFQQRYEFLTQKGIKEKWLRWRADQNLELIKMIRATLDSVNPKLKLYLSLNTNAMFSKFPNLKNIDIAKYYYENHGIDIKSLQIINNVHVSGLRGVTYHRWRQHWGKPSTALNDHLYSKNEAKSFRNKSGISYTNIYPTYFETFEKSLQPDIFKSYFQNADVKPFGRYFLKELAFNVGATDSQRILIGAQPVGTWGRDEETREFTRAYCALPAKVFSNVPGGCDPVTVRILNTDKGTYFYAVSQLWDNCETELTFSAAHPIKDISTGKIINPKGKLCKIILKPYQLRSFHSDAGSLAIINVKTFVKSNVIKFYKTRLNIINKAIKTLSKKGIIKANSQGIKISKKISELITNNEFAEVHRLIFSRTINKLLKQTKNIKNLMTQAKMIKNNNFTVDCGSSDYYYAPSGKLFFPDRKFDDAVGYGHFGNFASISRSTHNLKDTVTPVLFQNEAYDIDGYRFKLANGKYKVKLYFKVGYKPAARAGAFVFSIKIQGRKVLDNFDVFLACDKDFNKVAMKEFNQVEVKNGLLEIKFQIKPGSHPSGRLCNGIEIEKIGQ